MSPQELPNELPRKQDIIFLCPNKQKKFAPVLIDFILTFAILYWPIEGNFKTQVTHKIASYPVMDMMDDNEMTT